MEGLRISITDKIRKAFTEKSSSLIFPWRPHGHMAFVAEATRTLWMLRMAIQMEKKIRKSLNIFHIKKSCCDPAVHPDMCNWGLMN